MVRLKTCLIALLIPASAVADVLNIGSNLFYSTKKMERTVGVDPIRRLIFVTDGRSNLLIESKGNSSVFTYRKTLGESAYSLIFRRVGTQTVLFSGKEILRGTSYKAQESICPFLRSNTNNKLSSLSAQIEIIISSSSPQKSFNIEEYVDESCQENEDYFDIQGAIARNLSLESNPVLKCLSSTNNEDALLKIASYDDLLKLASETINNSSTGKFPKVTCKEDEENNINVLGSYASNSITLYSSKKKVKTNACSPIDTTVTHEYIHHLQGGGDTMSDESLVRAIEQVCWTNFGGDPALKDQCYSREGLVTDSRLALASTVTQEGGVSKPKSVAPALIAESGDEIRAEDNLEAQELVQSIPAANLARTQISDSGWSSIADAKPGTVPPAARQVIQAANSSFSSIGKIADRAFAILTKEVQAAAPSKLSSSSKSESTVGALGSSLSLGSRGSSAKSKDSDFKTVEEYLVGDSKPNKTGTGTVSVGAQPSTSSPATNNQAARAKARSTAASDPRAASNGSTEIAGSSGSVITGSNSASNVPQNFKPQASRTSGGTAAQAGSSRQPASSATGVQLLSAKTEVSGQDYRLIRRLYNDQSFKADLINLRIHIKTRAATLGVDPSRATHIFEDDGTKLKKIGGQ